MNNLSGRKKSLFGQANTSRFPSEIHQLLGKEYKKKVFNSIGQEILRTVVAQCSDW